MVDEEVKEGWEYPYIKADGTQTQGYPKAHYFRDGLSLCGKWSDKVISYLKSEEDWKIPELGDDYVSTDECKICRRKLDGD